MKASLSVLPEQLESVREWRKTLGAFLLCALVTTVAVVPFFYIGEDRAVGCCGGEMPVTHDAWMHFNQMQSFYRGLASGRIYPRWQEDTHSGYGAPTTSFYPPGVYYLTSLCHLLLRDWQRVWLATYWLMTFASGLGLYAYARRHLSHGSALLAMTIYLVLPYHLINQYQRGALAEQLSFVWVPLCLLFAEKLLSEVRQTWRNVAGLAGCFGAFLWSHPPTAYQFTLVFGLCLLIVAVARKQWRALRLMSLALLFGSCLAAAYFFPALLEQHLIHAGDVAETWPYHSTYVFDFQQTRFDHRDAFIARIDWLWAFNVGALLLVSSVAFLYRRLSSLRKTGLFTLRHQRGNNQIFRRLDSLRYVGRVSLGSAITQRFQPAVLWLVAGGLASFLMLRYSAPLGRLIPQLEIGVFSWRLLGLSSFAVALLAGACWHAAQAQSGGKQRWLPAFGVVAILVAAVCVSFRLVVWPMVRSEAFRPNPAHYNYATLPAQSPRKVPQMPEAQFAERDAGQIEVLTWQPEYRVLRVQAKQAAQLEVRTTDYPGWTALLDGQAVTIERGAVGNITLAVPAGEHRVVLDFRSTPLRRASNWLTVVAGLTWFALLISLHYTRA